MRWLSGDIGTCVFACIDAKLPSNQGPQLWGPRSFSIHPLYLLCLALVAMVLLENSSNSFLWHAPQVFLITSKSWLRVSTFLSCHEMAATAGSLAGLPPLSTSVYR